MRIQCEFFAEKRAAYECTGLLFINVSDSNFVVSEKHSPTIRIRMSTSASWVRIVQNSTHFPLDYYKNINIQIFSKPSEYMTY
jgi:hypothetical protein